MEPNIWFTIEVLLPVPETNYHIYGLVQDCGNSSALVMELLQFCTKPSVQ